MQRVQCSSRASYIMSGSLCSSSIGQSFHHSQHWPYRGPQSQQKLYSPSALITMTLGTTPFALLKSCYCCLSCIAWLQGCYMPTCYKNIVRRTYRCFRQGSHWIGGVSDFPLLPFHRYEIVGEAWTAALILGTSSSPELGCGYLVF